MYSKINTIITKILLLISLSILLVSCGNKQEEKVILDKDDQKIIEEVLDINNETEKKSKTITEKEVVEKINKTEEKIVETEEVKEEKKDVKLTPEEDKETDDLIKDLLGSESDVDSALDDVTK